MTNHAFWQQGEIQVGRPSARALIHPEEWVQTMLLPPRVLEIQIRLGIIAEENHLRWQIEAMDPSTKELLALCSRPACRLADLEDELGAVVNRLLRLLGPVLDLDPF